MIDEFNSWVHIVVLFLQPTVADTLPRPRRPSRVKPCSSIHIFTVTPTCRHLYLKRVSIRQQIQVTLNKTINVVRSHFRKSVLQNDEFHSNTFYVVMYHLRPLLLQIHGSIFICLGIEWLSSRWQW